MGQYILLFLIIFAAVIVATYIVPPTGKLALSDS